MTIKYKCLYEITGCIEDVNTFLVPLQDLPKQEQGEPVAWADALFAELKHGDEEHQLWLHEKLMSWALKNRKQEQGEPVAWRVKVDVKLSDGKVSTTYQLRNTKLSEFDEPLYTTPQQRKPLTDEQADSIINGLRTCLHRDSKREFLKTWPRD